MAKDQTDTPAAPLTCGLPYDEFTKLRLHTPLNRLNVVEGVAVFDKLDADGFKVVPK